VMAVFIAVFIIVGERQQVTGVGATLQPKQTTGQVLPVLGGVQRVDRAGGRVGVAETARILRAARLGDQRVGKGGGAVDKLGRGGAQRAGLGAGAVRGVVVECGLESRHLVDVFLD